VWAGCKRLRAGWLRVVEATITTTAAWSIAMHLFGHKQPSLAAASALIALGVTQGQRLQRATEIVVGVAVGLVVASMCAYALVPRTSWSLLIITLLTLSAAIFVGGGGVLAVQAAGSALAVAVTPTAGGLVPARFADALTGGVVALVVNQLPLHRDPIQALTAKARQAFDTFSAVLVATADALDAHDPDAAQAALNKARAAGATVAALESAINVGYDAVRLDPLRRRHQKLLGRYREVARQVDFAIRNVRGLSRGVVALTREPAGPPPALAESLRELARAVAALSEEVVRGARTGAADPSWHAVHDLALSAVRSARSAFTPDAPLPVAMIVWQVRSTALDILRVTGLDLAKVIRAVDEVLGTGGTGHPADGDGGRAGSTSGNWSRRRMPSLR